MLILENKKSASSFFAYGLTPIDMVAPHPGGGCDIVMGQQVYHDPASAPGTFMESLCLKNGTTLEGSYASSGYLLEGSYKRPIYIGGSCNQIFIPTSSPKDDHCTWLSLNYCLKAPLEAYNNLGYRKISARCWQKHVSDGIRLQYAIFRQKERTDEHVENFN